MNDGGMVLMKFETWKKGLESEFAVHRELNTKLIYSYQDGYDDYVNSSEWVMVGDFCNFVKKSALNDHEVILAKYEEILVSDLEVFKGFCEEEFERIKVWSAFLRDESCEDYALNIFKFNNFKVRYDDLSDEQRSVFDSALSRHFDVHSDDMELWGRLRG